MQVKETIEDEVLPIVTENILSVRYETRKPRTVSEMPTQFLGNQ